MRRIRSFSVVVPTLNRKAFLAETVEMLTRQAYPADGFEIIVVDNGSTDGTGDLRSSLTSGTSPKVRWIDESRRGLHFGRHAGARAATGEVLAYTDDDVRVDPNWLHELNAVYDAFDADAVGGRIDIEWDREPPDWIAPFEFALGRLDHGPEAKLLTAGQMINGGNFSILRKRLFEVGGFNPDQVGDYLVGDGETGLCRKIHQHGWRMAWAPSARIWHRQLVDRNGTVRDLRRRWYNNGVCDAYEWFRSQRPGRGALLRGAAVAGWESMQLHLRARCGGGDRIRRVLNAAKFHGRADYCVALTFHRSRRELALRNDWVNG